MGSFLQTLVFTFVGLVLLCFGCTLILRMERDRDEGGAGAKGRPPKATIRKRRREGLFQEKPAVEPRTGLSGNSKTCPVCSSLLEYGEQVRSTAFPGIPGQGRVMYIIGCVYCIKGGQKRKCPVCGTTLKIDEVLVARIFDKPGRSHVHVLGCSQCRGLC